MKVEYRTTRLEKACTKAQVAIREYGQEMAVKLQQRIRQIKRSDTLETLLKLHIGRCHPLHGDREGQYAMDLVHPYRLVFTKRGDEIQIARIEEIVDYH
jgi:proteic killer suppression protein